MGVLYNGDADCDIEGAVCAETEDTKFSVRDRDAWIFLVRTSRTSLKLADTSVSFPCSMKTTFLLCSPSWSAFGCCARDKLCREEICWLRPERSCLMMKVNSLISTGRSSNSVFRLATANHQHNAIRRLPSKHRRSSHCASFSNFPIVAAIPLPISAALLANSDLLGFPSTVAPSFAAAFCESVRSDCLCAPTLDEACRLCTWVRTDRNSFVRSWIEDTAILLECGRRARGSSPLHRRDD